ncbi:hypothetical protein FKP32DRAFT_1592911 [Trametes sanguinea]|nr:hypothetical protein FKP32DRAFT_1592911 [Trametes sanguinea]
MRGKVLILATGYSVVRCSDDHTNGSWPAHYSILARLITPRSSICETALRRFRNGTAPACHWHPVYTRLQVLPYCAAVLT